MTGSNHSSEAITIVSGLPRSGTSMMMRMLDAGGLPALTDELREADPDNPNGYYEFEPVKKTKDDASWLDRAAGKVVKLVHLILLDLPVDRRYRVVFMERNLQEVVRSQDVMLERSGKQTGGLPTDRIIEIFQSQMLKVSAYLAEKDCFDVLRVNYNDVINNPVAAVKQVNEFLGGSLDTNAMAAIVDPTLYRQRD